MVKRIAEYKNIWPKWLGKLKKRSGFHFFGLKSEKLVKDFILFVQAEKKVERRGSSNDFYSVEAISI